MRWLTPHSLICHQFILVYFNLVMAPDLSLSKSVDLAKRSLYAKEQNFLKNKPMSKDLREFIDRYRFKRQHDAKRSKRSQIYDEDQLYVIRNGQLLPFTDVKDLNKREEDSVKDGFTVIPLIVPLNGQSLKARLLKARNLNADASLSAVSDPTVAVANSVTSPVSAGCSTDAAALTNVSQSAQGQSNASAEDDANKTQEETKVLNKILEDIEGLMQSRHTTGNKKEGVICSVNGSWISDAAGMRFDINYQNKTRKKFRIHVAERIPPIDEGFLCDGNWSVFGELPFSHSGVVIVLAVHSKDKHLAVFIGECRVCEGSETVTGTWMIGRSSRDCKDEKASHKILTDIWKKEEAHLLRKKHLKQLGIDAPDED